MNKEKMQQLGELLGYFGSAFVEAGGVILEASKDMAEIEEAVVEEKKVAKKAAKKTTKKTTKKTAKKIKEEETPAREVFTKDDTPATPAERKLFKEQWEALGKEGQNEYISGAINSLGEVVESEASSASDDFELDDLPELDDDKEYSLDDLREKAKERAKKDGNKKGVAGVFKKYGYKKIDDVSSKDIANIYSEL